MGRYYSGDIKGKFWFSVQSSHAPERFGCKGHEPNFITYYTEDKQAVEKELSVIKKSLGGYFKKLNRFFKEHDGYNDEMLIAEGFPKDQIRGILRDYADYELGIKILKCLKKKGYCTFNAEL